MDRDGRPWTMCTLLWICEVPTMPHTCHTRRRLAVNHGHYRVLPQGPEQDRALPQRPHWTTPPIFQAGYPAADAVDRTDPGPGSDRNGNHLGHDNMTGEGAKAPHQTAA